MPPDRSRSRRRRSGSSSSRTAEEEESKKYQKKLKSLLKPRFPTKSFRFSAGSRVLMWKLYQKWMGARAAWRTAEPNIAVSRNAVSLQELRTRSKWDHLIQKTILAQIAALKDPTILQCSFPIRGGGGGGGGEGAVEPSFPVITVHAVFPSSSSSSSGHKSTTTTSSAQFSAIVRKMYTWLHIAYQYQPTTKSCSLDLRVYLYWMDIPKWINGNGLRDNNSDGVLGEKNANTGYTFACHADNEIHIYRSQEWYKVFMHETLHALGIDFSHDRKTIAASQGEVQKLFPRVHIPEVHLSETYTEMWAVVMHVMSMCLGTPTAAAPRVFDKVLAEMEKMVHLEIIFVLFQSVKIIQYNSDGFMNYEQMVHTSSAQFPTLPSTYLLLPYRQNTPIFEYYFLRAILFFHLNAFLEWCTRHNRDGEMAFQTDPAASMLNYGKSPIHSFVELIKKCYQQPLYRKAMQFVELKVESLKTKKFRRTLKNHEAAYRNQAAAAQQQHNEVQAKRNNNGKSVKKVVGDHDHRRRNTILADDLFLQTMRMTLLE